MVGLHLRRRDVAMALRCECGRFVTDRREGEEHSRVKAPPFRYLVNPKGVVLQRQAPLTFWQVLAAIVKESHASV